MLNKRNFLRRSLTAKCYLCYADKAIRTGQVLYQYKIMLITCTNLTVHFLLNYAILHPGIALVLTVSYLVKHAEI